MALIPILFNLMCSYKDRTINDFNAKQYNIQATEKGDHANSNHLYDAAGTDDKEDDSQSQSKPF